MIPLDSVIKELEGAIAGGSATRCSKISKGITDLFAVQAPHLSDAEILIFDELLTRLTIEIEVTARAIMAVRLAPIRNAPPRAIRKLAFDDAIEVAAPVLSQSERLTDADLVDNAACKSQEHLLVIAGRAVINESVTDVLVARGDRRVLLRTVGNKGARLSDTGFSVVVQRSDDDGELAICVGSRTEIPRHLLRQLVATAAEAVRAKLTAIRPEVVEYVHDIVVEAAGEVEAGVIERSQRRGAQQKRQTPRTREIDQSLTQNDLVGVALAVAASCNMPLEFVEQAIGQKSVETFLVLARAADLSVAALREILQLRGKGHVAINEIEKSVTVYRHLKIETAEEILRFYRTRAKQSRFS
jgi:Uncharacterised protein conserved in bacteria (DUF2336)